MHTRISDSLLDSCSKASNVKNLFLRCCIYLKDAHATPTKLLPLTDMATTQSQCHYAWFLLDSAS